MWNMFNEISVLLNFGIIGLVVLLLLVYLYIARKIQISQEK